MLPLFSQRFLDLCEDFGLVPVERYYSNPAYFDYEYAHCGLEDNIDFDDRLDSKFYYQYLYRTLSYMRKHPILYKREQSSNLKFVDNLF